MSDGLAPARPARLAVLVLSALAVLFVAACGGGDDTTSAGTDETTAESPAAESPTEEMTDASASPTEKATDEGAPGDVQALVDELESCLNDGGVETKSEMADLATYGEAATIDLTFEYDAITVPGAVTLYVYETEDAAAKGKKQIDQNLLEGDTKTLLRGRVVVDDFGTTLQEPEAAEQAEVVESCTA